MSSDRIEVVYRLGVPHEQAALRAQILALEQSIEMPLEAVMQSRVREEVVARVQSITPNDDGSSDARVLLSSETVGGDAGQLMNMVFGNSSLQDDVQVVDVHVPAGLAATLGGPNHGIDGLRRLSGVHDRPLTCAALKPIGASAEEMAALCGTFARAGVDLIKDDHGWADQRSAPFRVRVEACGMALAAAAQDSGNRALYAPSLSGSFAQMQEQIAFARDHGVRMFLIAPMIAGVANFHALTRAAPDVAFVAHPALCGTGFTPPALIGKLFRLFGADAVIFPNQGGRFAYTRATCHAVAAAARAPWHALKSALPVPAGGMTVDRVPELVREYGRDTVLLIGGALLTAREQLSARTRAFVAAVRDASQAASSQPVRRTEKSI